MMDLRSHHLRVVIRGSVAVSILISKRARVAEAMRFVSLEDWCGEQDMMLLAVACPSDPSVVACHLDTHRCALGVVVVVAVPHCSNHEVHYVAAAGGG